MSIKVGDKYVYTERNSVFEVSSLPRDGSPYYTVYYPATGEYRRYAAARIGSECRPYTGAPKKKTKPSIQVTLPGFPAPVVLNPNTGEVSCGCHRSTSGALPILLAALKGLKK